jgi:hypothetical protein
MKNFVYGVAIAAPIVTLGAIAVALTPTPAMHYVTGQVAPERPGLGSRATVVLLDAGQRRWATHADDSGRFVLRFFTLRTPRPTFYLLACDAARRSVQNGIAFSASQDFFDNISTHYLAADEVCRAL